MLLHAKAQTILFYSLFFIFQNILASEVERAPVCLENNGTFYTPCFPSDTDVDLLLRGSNPLTTDEFLRRVMSVSISHYDSNKIDNELLTRQLTLIKLSLEKDADPNNIDYFSSFPPDAVIDLLLNARKPLNPNKFFTLIVTAPTNNNIDNEIVNELLGKQLTLAKLALEKGADPNRIPYLTNLPSDALVALLLNGKKALDPNKFLTLIMHVPTNNISLARQLTLIKLSLEKGADPNNIGYFSNLPSDDVINLLMDAKKPLDSNKLLSLIMAIPQENYSDNKSLIKQLVLIKLALERGANPNNIEYFSSFPSDSVVNLLLNGNQPLDPNKFLTLVMNVSVNNELLARQLTLIRLALEKDANPNDISHFLSFPSDDVVDLLLNCNKPLDPNTFLKLVATTNIKDYSRDKEGIVTPKLTMRQYVLIKLAFEKGANKKILSYIMNHTLPTQTLNDFLSNNILTPNEFLRLTLDNRDNNNQEISLKNIYFYGVSIDQFPQIETEYKLNNTVYNHKLFFLQKQLATWLNKEHPIKKAKMARRIAARGHCYAFTTLWLYSKWLQFKQPKKTGGYNNEYDKDWFNNTIKFISELKDGTKLSSKKAADFEKFAEQIDFLQSPKEYIEGMRAADIRIHQIENRLTTDGMILREKYNIALRLDSIKQLTCFLSRLVFEDEMIYIIISGHYSGLFKHDNVYHYYNSFNYFGEYKFNSIEELANCIFSSGQEIGFVICNFDQNFFNYLTPKSMLTTFNISNSFSATNHVLMAAIMARSLESVDFLLNQGLDTTKTYNTYYDVIKLPLLGIATEANDPKITAMLLKKYGLNPGGLLPYGGDTETKEVTGMTCLHLAAKKGYFEVLKVFLDDPRTKNIITQKDSTGKIALDYAIEKNHKQTIKILETIQNQMVL